MILEAATLGYEAGTELRDVSLREARAMECNRCGGCCSGLLPDDVVKKDAITGLPLFVWGSKFPEDLYESRYGKPMLQPIGFMDDSSEMPYQGRIGVVDKFEKDASNKPHTCFTCSFHSMDGENKAHCELLDKFHDGQPSDLSTIRPLNCGEFPVFSSAVDDTLIAGHSFIPAVGALPSCTWYGIRIVGPYKNEPYWIERWERQQAGEPVSELKIPQEFIDGLVYKAERRREANGE